jgi:putative transposase
MTLFNKRSDYDAFEQVLTETHQRTGVRIAAYCVMPNHWHLLLWPREDGELSEVMRWLTVTHTQRWHAHHHTAGTGPLYQGRFKSFPVQTDAHFLTVARYIEHNPLRAGLVERAENWHWSSLRRFLSLDSRDAGLLCNWPVERPKKWVQFVNDAMNDSEIESLRQCVTRGRPFGTEDWLSRIVKYQGLESTIRPRGRPRKQD